MIIRKKLREDVVSVFYKYLSYPVGQVLYVFATGTMLIGFRARAIKYLLTSIRYCDSKRAVKQLKLILRAKPDSLQALLSDKALKNDAEGRAIILSLPMESSGRLVKGVMLLTFSHTFSYFILHPAWSKLNKLFAFVLEPSWAGYADADILEFVRKSEHCVIQASELRDRVFLNSLHPDVPCLDTGASNWVGHSFFKPKEDECEKDIDVVYIANGNPVKRVFRAVNAIAEVVKICPEFQGVIICAEWGGDNNDLKRYVRNKRLSKNIKILDGMKQSDLVGFLCRSKASMMLSLKEGSNRVLFESMFVNVPVICLSENIGVNKSYINAFTGLLVNDSQLPGALLHMRNNYNRYSPRSWAVENISPEITTKKLSNVIKQYFGDSVNERLQIKVNKPEVKYKDIPMQSQELMHELMFYIESHTTAEVIDELNTKHGNAFSI